MTATYPYWFCPACPASIFAIEDEELERGVEVHEWIWHSIPSSSAGGTA